MSSSKLPLKPPRVSKCKAEQQFQEKEAEKAAATKVLESLLLKNTEQDCESKLKKLRDQSLAINTLATLTMAG